MAVPSSEEVNCSGNQPSDKDKEGGKRKVGLFGESNKTVTVK